MLAHDDDDALYPAFIPVPCPPLGEAVRAASSCRGSGRPRAFALNRGGIPDDDDPRGRAPGKERSLALATA